MRTVGVLSPVSMRVLNRHADKARKMFLPGARQ
jgi:hypothetical protein